MPYNEKIEQRINNLEISSKCDKKKMFGGVCYLTNGNMAFGIYKDFLIVRLEKTDSEKYLKQKYVKPFDITGKVMKGWVMVEPDGFKTKDKLIKWANRGIEFAEKLPPK